MFEPGMHRREPISMAALAAIAALCIGANAMAQWVTTAVSAPGV